MDRIRYLAAGLLCLNGLLHVIRVGMPQTDAVFVATAVLFGAVYLAIGGSLLWNARTACYFGAIVPLVGLGVGLYGGLAGMVTGFNPWMALLAALDAAVVASCFHLIKARRRAPEPPKAT